MKILLLVFTRIFDPFAVICGMYLLVFIKFGRLPQDAGLLGIIIFANIIIPISYFLNLIRLRKVQNWDVTNKNERRQLFGPLIIFAALSTGAVYGFSLFAVLSPDAARLMQYFLRLQVTGILLFLYLYLVSPFFKSSGHVGVMSAAYLFILKMFGMAYVWVIILVIIQAGARVVLKKHTLPEVIAGFASGIVIGGMVVLLL